MAFRNEPFIDFSIESNRAAFRGALSDLENNLRRAPIKTSPRIFGHTSKSSVVYTRKDPGCSSVIVAENHFADVLDAKAAISLAKKHQSAWADAPAELRAQTLKKAAELMRQERFEIAALMAFEGGKGWVEADVEIAEAIDFCEYYADEWSKLSVPKTTMPLSGESNIYFYEPRGVAVVIGPWNFPFAIPCGMAVAALVTGNSVILKPSEQTTAIADKLVNILFRAGVPEEALYFVPGFGEDVGDTLVKSADTDLVVFTGSKQVGLMIIENCAKVLPGQRNVKRVIAEMGGKNAIIVDSDADQDEAIKGVLQSAFGFAGQKCSACSRLIIVGDRYEPFLKRLAEAVKDVPVGRSQDSDTIVTSVIDSETQARLLNTIEQAKKTDKLLVQGRAGPSNGYFVPPTVFRDVSSDSTLWREEQFGPVLACVQAKDFDHAINLANDSAYALTGGVYSRNPAHIKDAYKRFKVGNLYINRKCTGAIVCRQPFGGAKMSGVGSKAGGPDYLIQFVEPRTVTEKNG